MLSNYNRQNSFVGQVNNILCFLRKLTSVVKCKLFKAYCYSFYGCELWSLEHSKLNDFVIAWRKGVRRIWGLPYNTHSDLLPILSNCLPIFDEICRRFLVFSYNCIHHDSEIIRSVASYSLLFARNDSVLGKNAIFCSQRYGRTLDELFLENVHLSTHVINNYCDEQTLEDRMSTALFLHECVLLRDGVLSF